MTQQEIRPAKMDAPAVDDKPEGPISAAIIAAGVGALALGLLTVLAEASASVKDFLTWSDPVGPLSGKTLGVLGTFPPIFQLFTAE